jgi:subtilisin family serine protease
MLSTPQPDRRNLLNTFNEYTALDSSVSLPSAALPGLSDPLGQSRSFRSSSIGTTATTNSYSISTNRDIPINTNQTLNGALSTTDLANPTRIGIYRDDYLLTGFSTGQQIRVNMTSSFDNYLQLVNAATGEVIIQRDDANNSSNAEITFTAQAGINYLIRATSFSSGATGTYTLKSSLVPATSSFNSTYGYGLADAAAAVARAIGQATPFPDVPNRSGNDWGLDMVNAPEVWGRDYTGQGIVVAVVDSGVDYNHSDLDANIWTNTREIAGNGIDDDGNGYMDDVRGWDFVDRDNNPMDLNGHGTHVAGTIAAENNGSGVTGVAYNARIMPVRVLNASGTGSTTSVAAGIRYAAYNGANAINLSLGGGYSSEIEAAVRYAIERGSVVVMAAGNNGLSQPGYPARHATQWGIAVGAVDSNNRMASFSNRAGTTMLDYVVAPGVSVYSTYLNNTYRFLNGTSMATPHVAGIAALMLSANRNLTPAQVETILTATANSTRMNATTAV